MTPLKAALLLSIARLDEEGAQAVYDLLASRAEDEGIHAEGLLESWSAEERADGEKAQRALEPILQVVQACEIALYGLAS